MARIRRLVVDESHLVFLWGLTIGKNIAFRPAWGRIGEARIRFRDNTPCLALTATAPPQIESAIISGLSMDNPIVLRSTVNRPNITYASHPIHGTLRDFANLQFLIPDLSAFDIPESISAHDLLCLFKKTIVFMDDKSLITASVFALYSRFPLWLRPLLQSLGLIKVYHSDMSTGYLDNAYSSFASENGFCMILIASSGAAQGLDLRYVQVAVQYGMCSSIAELLQRLGRCAREAYLRGLGLLLAEKWADGKSKKPTAKELRTAKEVKEFAICKKCKRRYLAEHSHDQSPDGETLWQTYSHETDLCLSAVSVVDGAHCCDGHDDPTFDLASYVPGTFYSPPPPPSATSKSKRKRPVKRYRETWQRDPLTLRIQSWLCSATASLNLATPYLSSGSK